MWASPPGPGASRFTLDILSGRGGGSPEVGLGVSAPSAPPWRPLSRAPLRSQDARAASRVLEGRRSPCASALTAAPLSGPGSEGASLGCSRSSYPREGRERPRPGEATVCPAVASDGCTGESLRVGGVSEC